MKLPAISKVKTTAKARELAVDWQIWQSEEALSYSELAEYADYSTKLAEKFNLTREFKENGVI